MAEMRWLPLESNPEVMNKYAMKLGVSSDWAFHDVYDLSKEGLKILRKPILAVLLLCPEHKYLNQLGVSDDWCFVDVFAFDADLLCFIPRPVAAVMLLFPISEKSESEMIGTEVDESGVYFMKQTIGNACGTIGIIHALLNNEEKLGFDKSKHLNKFLGSTKDLTPEERGKILESDDAFGEAHEEVANEGQTKVPSRDDKVDLHFVAFIHHKGTLYELDGRRNGPVSHGPTTEDTLLEDSVEVVKKFIARDPTNLNFTVVALSKA